MENMRHTAIIETCKSEPQGGVTLRQSEWPSAKRLQTINAETPRRKGSAPTRLMKMQTGNMHSGEQCVEVLHKLGTKLVYDLATPALDLPSEKHRISEGTPTFSAAPSTTSKPRTPPVSTDRGTEKDAVLCVHSGMLATITQMK